MRVGSLFSGIGGIDLAAERAGMRVIWQAEIDPFCCAVLRKRFIETLQVGNVLGMTEDILENIPDIDVLVGGFPCQDVSVAGKRAGLSGARSGLFFEFARIVAERRPRWLLIENVPGLLSSHGGKDMGTVLWTLAQLGYGYAYRVLDAQFFGVPQRRRRVFIVACAAGDVRRAAAVLFEPESGGGHPAPRRAEREDIAFALAASVRGTGNAHNTTYVPVAGDEPFVGQQHGSDVGRFGTLRAEGTTAGNGLPFVAHALTSHPDRQDATSDTYVVAPTLQAGQRGHPGGATQQDAENGALIVWDQAQITSKANRSRVEPGLPSPPCAATGQLMVAFDDPRRFDNRHGGSGEHRDIHPTLESINPKTLVANTLRASDGHHGFSSPCGDGGDNQVVAEPFVGQQHGSDVGRFGTLRAEGTTAGNGLPFVAAPLTAGGHPNSNMPGRHREDDENLVAFYPTGGSHGVSSSIDQSPSLKVGTGLDIAQASAPAISSAAGVRRLTPVECERLQGFPDSWTCLFDHPQPCECSDGPRYRSLGNAVAVPVVEWILRRLMEVDSH